MLMIFNFIENKFKIVNENDIKTINFKNEIIFKLFEKIENEIKENKLNNYDIKYNKYDNDYNIIIYNKNENDLKIFISYFKYNYNFKKVNNEINNIIKDYDLKKEKFFK